MDRVYIVGIDEVPKRLNLAEREHLRLTFIVMPGVSAEVPFEIKIGKPGVHLEIFGKGGGDPVRLSLFEVPQLITQILLVLSLVLHIITNIRPLMISLGMKSYKELVLDLALILSIILLFAGAGFTVYYFRWQP